MAEQRPGERGHNPLSEHEGPERADNQLCFVSAQGVPAPGGGSDVFLQENQDARHQNSVSLPAAVLELLCQHNDGGEGTIYKIFKEKPFIKNATTPFYFTYFKKTTNNKLKAQ